MTDSQTLTWLTNEDRQMRRLKEPVKYTLRRDQQQTTDLGGPLPPKFLEQSLFLAPLHQDSKYSFQLVFSGKPLNLQINYYYLYFSTLNEESALYSHTVNSKKF